MSAVILQQTPPQCSDALVPGTSVYLNFVHNRRSMPFLFLPLCLLFCLSNWGKKLQADQKRCRLSLSVSAIVYCSSSALCIETMGLSVEQLSCLLPTPHFPLTTGTSWALPSVCHTLWFSLYWETGRRCSLASFSVCVSCVCKKWAIMVWLL